MVLDITCVKWQVGKKPRGLIPHLLITELVFKSSIRYHGPWGILKFGFGRDVPPQNLKVDPYKYQFFGPIHKPIRPKLRQILSKITRFFQNFLKFEPILAQIWENLEKSTVHSYTKLHFIPGIICQEADCYPCWRHMIPVRVLCTLPLPTKEFWFLFETGK